MAGQPHVDQSVQKRAGGEDNRTRLEADPKLRDGACDPIPLDNEIVNGRLE
jgi:hypothetical protein